MEVGDLVRLRLSATYSRGELFTGVIVSKRSDPEGFIFEVFWSDSKSCSFVRPKALVVI